MFGLKKKDSKPEVPNIIVEGGDFKCFIHGFGTSDINEWDKHCIETKHTVSGETLCADCGHKVYFENKPFRGVGKVPIVFCDKCRGEEH